MMASLATKLVLSLFVVAFISIGGAADLEALCMNGQPDETRFLEDSAFLNSVACLPLSHCKLLGWKLVSHTEHSLSWTRKINGTKFLCTRICQEFIDIPPEEVYEMQSNTTLRRDYDQIMEVEKMCQLSDSVDVLHSSLSMSMGMSPRELFQYRKCTEDADGYEILYQDVKNNITVTEGMVRARLPFAGTLIRPHPDTQLPNSTMATTVFMLNNSWMVPDYMMDFFLSMMTDQYQTGMVAYFRNVMEKHNN